MFLAQCPYCEMNTVGEHETNCSMSKVKFAQVEKPLEGWECPRCGQVWAPWVNKCTCIKTCTASSSYVPEAYTVISWPTEGLP